MLKRIEIDNKSLRITLVNTHFCDKKVSTVIGYFGVAKSENDIGFFKSVLVFEIFYIFFKKVL